MLSILLLSLIINITADSNCPRFGRLNYTCRHQDYCNPDENLVCGDGECGRECPPGWNTANIQGKRFCYSIFNTTENFTMAEQTCKTYNAEVLTTKTCESVEFYNQLVEQDVWVSATAVDYLTFKWPDNSILYHTSPLWCDDEPNFYDQDERCVIASMDGCLIDTICDNSNAFICEIEIKLCTIGTTCQCDDDYYLEDGRCIQLKGSQESCSFSSNECNYKIGLKCDAEQRCSCEENLMFHDEERICYKKCEFGWLYANDNCYLLDKNKRDRSSSNATAYTSNGYLVKFDNQEEFNEIKTFYEKYLSPEKTWIGSFLIEDDACFNLGESFIEFPTQNAWCPDAASSYTLDSCTYMTKINGLVCISYASCDNLFYSIYERMPAAIPVNR